MFYAVTVCKGNIIKPEDLPAEILEKLNIAEPANSTNNADNKLSMQDVEKVMIINALKQTENNVSEAAKLLKMSRSTLYRKIKLYEI